RDSLLGRPSFQVQAYPFRLTPANLARHRTHPQFAFWKTLKVGNDHFEATHLEPKVDVCDRRYVFDAQAAPNSPNPLVFNPPGKVPRFVREPENGGGGAGETTRGRGEIRPIAKRRRASRPNLQRAGRRNE